MRLVLRVEGVEEFRFQMRPNLPKAKIADARISYLNGLFFVSLDSLGPRPGELAAGSSTIARARSIVGGRELLWEERPRGSAGDSPTMPG